MLYEDEDGRLLRDCVRAADIVDREIKRERGASEERLTELLREYKAIHKYILERFLDIYQDNAVALEWAAKAAQLYEMLDAAPDMATTGVIIKSIRRILKMFA